MTSHLEATMPKRHRVNSTAHRNVRELIHQIRLNGSRMNYSELHRQLHRLVESPFIRIHTSLRKSLMVIAHFPIKIENHSIKRDQHLTKIDDHSIKSDHSTRKIRLHVTAQSTLLRILTRELMIVLSMIISRPMVMSIR
jgi:hypothetical protein